MKLLEVLPLLESRKNPEQNPKLSAYEQLLKYKDNPNVYISMTELPKLGINPTSLWDTANGIYCYPLQTIWRIYKVGLVRSLSVLPFKMSAPYIQVFEWNGKGKVVHISGYDDGDLDRDINKIKKMFPDAIDRIDYGIKHASQQDRPASKLFYTVMLLSQSDKKFILKRDYDTKDKKMGDYKEHSYSPTGLKSANIFRALGYSGFVDNGYSVIHPNEPYQAVFLSKEYVNHLDTILNKNYKRYKHENLDKSNYMEGGMYIGDLQGNKIILANKDTEKMLPYLEAAEYCKSLGGGWHLPTLREMSFISKNFKKNWAYQNSVSYEESSLGKSTYWVSGGTETKPLLVKIELDEGVMVHENQPAEHTHGVVAVKTVSTSGKYLESGTINYKQMSGGIYLGDYHGKKMILASKSLEHSGVTWDEAEQYVQELGSGWKIPTKDEWVFIHDNTNFVNSDYTFNAKSYWTSDMTDKNLPWYYDIDNNKFSGYHVTSIPGYKSYKNVRPIKLVKK
jgi:hypothetical protein